MTARILLWLFAMNLGVAFGAGIYEHRIVVSRWLTSGAGSVPAWNAEAARQDDTGRRFWVFISTIPLTLLTLASLLAAWRADGTVRGWWLAAAAAATAERVLTFAYFIPALIGLMSAADSPNSAASAIRWSHLNYLRHAIVLVAWLAAMQAFAACHREAPLP